MPPQTHSERDLDRLAAELKRLESEYTKYFAGRLPQPPVELRDQVDRLFRQWDRRTGESSAARFRLQTLQARYATFRELWDRNVRAREEGPHTPAGRRAGRPAGAEPGLRNETFAAVIHDPAREPARVRSLYDAVMEARRQTGHDVVPYQQFAELVERQMEQLRGAGVSEVVFRVSVSGGRPNLTARAVRRKRSEDGDE